MTFYWTGGPGVFPVAFYWTRRISCGFLLDRRTRRISCGLFIKGRRVRVPTKSLKKMSSSFSSFLHKMNYLVIKTALFFQERGIYNKGIYLKKKRRALSTGEPKARTDLRKIEGRRLSCSECNWKLSKHVVCLD